MIKNTDNINIIIFDSIIIGLFDIYYNREKN